MGYKDLDLEDTYESGVNDIVENFYAPVLQHSVQYDRIAGFFSSSCLAIAARGVADFIDNGGHMRLITSPRLNENDAEIVERFVNNPDSLTAEELGLDLSDIADEIESNHVKALGWMLQQGSLEIRLAVVCRNCGTEETTSETGLFHQKVGIFTDDEGNQLSFSGSINETASAWANNDEEFKVFKAWDEHKGYFDSDKKRFEELWFGQRKNVKVFSLPSAVKNKLINYSKDFDKEKISLQCYLLNHKRKPFDFHDYTISLFPFQADALNQWKKNKFCQLFEMATGCGKTRTAIAGIKYLQERNPQLLTIVTTPQNTLTRQWISEFSKLDVFFDEFRIIDGTNSRWRDELLRLLLRVKTGMVNHVAIFTTHTTASSDDFIAIIREKYSEEIPIVFVGDETHWLGAPKLQKALLQEYKYRIGLSATPSRWFDDEGTLLLSRYYGNNHFEFKISDALREINPITKKHFLVNYYYYLNRIKLTGAEGAKYKKITKQLIQLSSKKDNDKEAANKYERLLEKRADIIKNAEGKYEKFEDIITQLKKDNALEDIIVFVSPQQKDQVIQILCNNGVVCHTLTQKEGSKESSKFGGLSERQYIIKKFIEKEYQVIVAIKCLDEGIDIPSACRGILMASSTNPREYVQRIGRIIRQDTGKGFAYLYDMYVDTVTEVSEDDADFEKRIREKEQMRIKEIADNAINIFDVSQILMN